MTTQVDINDWHKNDWSATIVDMFDWCIHNCPGGFEVAPDNRYWTFEKEEDAVLFVIRWA
jgi:hypothetical protein